MNKKIIALFSAISLLCSSCHSSSVNNLEEQCVKEIHNLLVEYRSILESAKSTTQLNNAFDDFMKKANELGEKYPDAIDILGNQEKMIQYGLALELGSIEELYDSLCNVLPLMTPEEVHSLQLLQDSLYGATE